MLLMLLVVACTGSTKDTGTQPTPTEEGGWEVVVEEGLGGVMLGAFSAGDELIAVGGQLNDSTASVWHLVGDSFCVETEVAEKALWWIHGRSATDFYMVGESGLIIHEVNGTRTREDVDTPATLFGVFDTGTDVWAIGGDIFGDQTGEIWRKASGGEWELAETTPGLGFKVWEDWFVGDGFAWRFNGTDFDDLTPAGAPRLTTVRGRSTDDVWVVGGLQIPEFHHFDGQDWTSPTIEPRCVSQALNGVYTEPGMQVFVAGQYGISASYDEGTWDCSEEPLTSQHFHAIWPHNGSMWALGGNLGSTATLFATVARLDGEGTIEPTISECAR